VKESWRLSLGRWSVGQECWDAGDRSQARQHRPGAIQALAIPAWLCRPEPNRLAGGAAWQMCRPRRGGLEDLSHRELGLRKSSPARTPGRPGGCLGLARIDGPVGEGGEAHAGRREDRPAPGGGCPDPAGALQTAGLAGGLSGGLAERGRPAQPGSAAIPA
jgi:hypothetical protein